jgi:hypothetical protein
MTSLPGAAGDLEAGALDKRGAGTCVRRAPRRRATHVEAAAGRRICTPRAAAWSHVQGARIHLVSAGARPASRRKRPAN